MPKPFKNLQSLPSSKASTAVEAAASMTPQQVMQESARSGREIGDVIRKVAAPDREVGGAPREVMQGTRANGPTTVYPEGVPWPAVGAAEAVGKLPFKNLK